MGLACSHNAWSGAYSAFSRWRLEITKVAEVAPNFDKYEEKNFYGEWDTAPSDPLFILLVHSDCEGEIKPEHAGPLADRLEALLPQLRGDFYGHIGDIDEKTKLFIIGLRAAVAVNESVHFS